MTASMSDGHASRKTDARNIKGHGRVERGQGDHFHQRAGRRHLVDPALCVDPWKHNATGYGRRDAAPPSAFNFDLLVHVLADFPTVLPS